MRTQVISDQELLASYLNGSEFSLEVLINRHKRKIFSSIYLLVKNRCLAQDIFQDTFIKVIRTLKSGNYNEEGKFLPWVLRIAHNLVVDHFRREKRMPTITTNDDFDIFEVLGLMDENREEELLKEQVRKDLREVIMELPHEQKEVIILRHFGNLSFKEIAKMTDVSINTALGRMRYALTNLRKLVEEKQLSLKA